MTTTTLASPLPAPSRGREVTGPAGKPVRRTLDMLGQWEQRKDPGQPLDVAEELTSLTMAIIGETMFGTRLDADTHAVSQAIAVLLADITFRFQVPFYPSLRWPTLRNRRALACHARRGRRGAGHRRAAATRK